MRTLRYLFVFVCACMFLMSCEDDKITLTVNTSAYDAVKDLKDVDGNPYFTGKLPEGLRIRVSYLVARQGSMAGDDKIVAQDIRYIDDISASVSYTTDELIPGEYRVAVVTDFIKGETEYNTIKTNYNDFQVQCKNSEGVYNAFGTGILKDISVTKKESVTLNTVKRGSLVTMLFENADKATGWSYNLSTEKYHFTNGEFTANSTFGDKHEITTDLSSAQYYCGFDKFTIAWYGSRYQEVITNGKDVIVNVDFATNLPPR